MSDLLGKLYDEIAPEYERVRAPRFRPFAKSLMRLYDTRPGSLVLDAGCGTGLVSTMVAPRAGHGGKVIGVDASAAMLEIARANARGFGFDQCDFRLGDIHALEFSDDTFDLVVSSFALWGEPASAFREFRRVLKPRGVLLLLEWDRDADAVTTTFNDVLAKYRVAAPDASLAAARAMLDEFRAQRASLREPKDFVDALRAAGFGEAHGGWDTQPMQFANADELFTFVNLGWAHYAEWAHMDADTRARFRADAVNALQAFGSGKIVLDKRALQLAARK